MLYAAAALVITAVTIGVMGDLSSSSLGARIGAGLAILALDGEAIICPLIGALAWAALVLRRRGREGASAGW